MGSIRRMVQDIRYVLSGVAAFIIFRDFCRGYGILQNTWSTVYYSRECRKGLWPIRKTPIKLFWPPTVPHVKWNAGFFFSLFMSSYIHQRFSRIMLGTLFSFGKDWSGEGTVVSSMSTSIRTSSTSMIQLKLPRPEPFFISCSSLQMTLCFISDSKRVSYSHHWDIQIIFTCTSTFASTIFKLTYGMDIMKNENSSLIKTAEIVATAISEAGNPGTFLVDSFPWMKFVPAWFPGAGWKRKGQYWRNAGECFVHVPWNRVKEQLVWYLFSWITFSELSLIF